MCLDCFMSPAPNQGSSQNLEAVVNADVGLESVLILWDQKDESDVMRLMGHMTKNNIVFGSS